MSLINRNDIRRLEKAAREKDKKHLLEWADRLEQQISQDLKRQLDIIKFLSNVKSFTFGFLSH